ncbi:MAG: hypothetical protein ABI374_07335 [Ginsengibacter sp.]
MPSAIGHPDLLELLQDETVKTKRQITSNITTNFFMGNGLLDIFLKVKTRI